MSGDCVWLVTDDGHSEIDTEFHRHVKRHKILDRIRAGRKTRKTKDIGHDKEGDGVVQRCIR
jgi:hypothetical protein